MYKFKIFMGSQKNHADIQANKWLEKHQNISIINVSYQQARYGDHSICIFYNDLYNEN